MPPELADELSEIAERCGCELVHLEFKGGVLRLTIDRPEGVSLDECSAVSRAASPVLDLVDFGPQGYTLEVSSPGLDRPLYRPRDYERFVGRRVRVTLRAEAQQAKRTFVAQLEGFSSESGRDPVVTLREHEDQPALSVPLTRIQIARLAPEL